MESSGRARALAVGLSMVVALACGRAPRPGRTIVLGLDGMDPQTVDLLLSEGKLPAFAKLRRDGAYGRLLSSKPLLSPVVWTTIATGKTPDQHGIGHFVAIDEKTGEPLPVTSEMRRVKAVWDILSDAKRKVAVVGWWARGRRRGERRRRQRSHVLSLPLSPGSRPEERSRPVSPTRRSYSRGWPH